jgi:curved DNA-binding protein CbpA
MADFYELLGLSSAASVTDIRKAYALIARDKHPDRFTDPVEKERAQEYFKDVTTAFNTLSNEKSRQEYDQALSKPKLTSPEEIAEDAYTRGLQTLEAKDLQGAVDLLRVAVYNIPGDARYHHALAVALARAPAAQRDAIQSLERAIQLAPTNAGYRAELAALFLREGLSLRARREAETALRLAPGDARVRRVAAEAGVSTEPEEPREGGGLLDRFRKKP